MNTPESIKPLLERPVAIFGHGVSGKGMVDLLKEEGCDYQIFDERAGEAGVLHEFRAEQAARFGLIIRSPGFADDHPWIACAQQAGCEVMGELDFASAFWPGSLVAVTGTNGKTTLTDFLVSALKRNGVDAVAVGNIGYPLSRACGLAGSSSTVAVCEVSSFQAEGVRFFKPKAVLWTNFDQDHLDRYASMADYFEAKWTLVEQLDGGVFIAGKSVIAFAETQGKRLPENTLIVDREAEQELVPQGSCFDSYPQAENYLIARHFWQSEKRDLSVLEASAHHFALAKHRVANVGEVGSVSFWNDSKGTNFASALAALKSMSRPVYWVGGGKSKGGDLGRFVEQLSECVRAAFLIGEVAEEIQTLLTDRGIAARVFQTLEEAVFEAHLAASVEESCVLLSPGFSSQDMFVDYAQRGISFERAVLSLKRNLSPSN